MLVIDKPLQLFFLKFAFTLHMTLTFWPSTFFNYLSARKQTLDLKFGLSLYQISSFKTSLKCNDYSIQTKAFLVIKRSDFLTSQ